MRHLEEVAREENLARRLPGVRADNCDRQPTGRRRAESRAGTSSNRVVLSICGRAHVPFTAASSGEPVRERIKWGPRDDGSIPLVTWVSWRTSQWEAQRRGGASCVPTLRADQQRPQSGIRLSGCTASRSER